MPDRLEDFRRVELLFPSNYLCAIDLRGRDATVVILDIEPRHELRRADGAKERKPVMRFVGKEKALVLNKTNAKIIAGLYGKDVVAWRGKAITLYPTEVQCGGKLVDAIRVRPNIPRQDRQREPEPAPPPPRAPEPEDDFDAREAAEAERALGGRP